MDAIVVRKYFLCIVNEIRDYFEGTKSPIFQFPNYKFLIHVVLFLDYRKVPLDLFHGEICLTKLLFPYFESEFVREVHLRLKISKFTNILNIFSNSFDLRYIK
jgi:hypothetical protein